MKKIWINKARSYEEAQQFDRKFWQKAGVTARFSAAWIMIKEHQKIKGTHGDKLRLRRSIQNIERI